MATFDIIDSVGHAYRFIWLERRYVARLALAPVLVKLACHLAVEGFGYGSEFIRQGLIMLPSYFLDGWMLSHIVRFALFGQRRPQLNHENHLQILHDRIHGILTGTAVFVVTRFGIMGMMALLEIFIVRLSPNAKDVPPSVRPEAFIGAMIFLLASLWAFRLLWLFIPAAGNVSMISLLRRIRGFSISFYMLGVWLVSFLPLILIFTFITSIIIAPFGGVAGGTVPTASAMIVTAAWALADTVIGVVATYAMATGLRGLLRDAFDDHRPA